MGGFFKTARIRRRSSSLWLPGHRRSGLDRARQGRGRRLPAQESALRVTLVFRATGAWRLVHRHADRLPTGSAGAAAALARGATRRIDFGFGSTRPSDYVCVTAALRRSRSCTCLTLNPHKRTHDGAVANQHRCAACHLFKMVHVRFRWKQSMVRLQTAWPWHHVGCTADAGDSSPTITTGAWLTGYEAEPSHAADSSNSLASIPAANSGAPTFR